MAQGTLSSIDLLLIFGYFALLLAIGFFASRKQKHEDYLIADRKLGAWSSMATINASKTGSVLMLFVAFVYIWGIGAVWYFIGQVFGILIFLPFALRLKEQSQRYYTLSHYFRYNYGKNAAALASLLTIIIMFGFLIINLIAGTKIFVFFTGWDFWICALIVMFVVLAYLLMAGFKAVVKTDVLQYFAMVFIVGLLTYISFNSAIIPASEWNLFNVDIGTMIGFFLIGGMFPFAMPDLWQRVYSARDKLALKKGILLSALVYAIFGALLALIAVTIKVKFPGADPDLALIYGFRGLLPTGMLGLSVVLLFAAIMSTIDTNIFTTASCIIQDFTNWSKKETIKQIRRVTILLAIIGTLLAIMLQDLVISTYVFAGFILVLATVVISTWIRKKIKRLTIISGFLVGIIGVVSLLIYYLGFAGGVKPVLVVIGILLTLGGLILGKIIASFT